MTTPYKHRSNGSARNETFIFKYFIRYHVSLKYFTNSCGRMKKSTVLWFHKDRNYGRKHVLSFKSQFDLTKEHAQPLGAAHFKLSTAHSFFFKYFIRFRISSRYFTNSFRRMKKSCYYDFIKIGNVEETCQISKNCESMIQVHSKFYRREWITLTSSVWNLIFLN